MSHKKCIIMLKMVRIGVKKLCKQELNYLRSKLDCLNTFCVIDEKKLHV